VPGKGCALNPHRKLGDAGKNGQLAQLSPVAGDWPVTSLWNRSKTLSASAVVLPFTLCVIIDAEALEMAHPEPWKLMSRIESPSKSR